MLASQSECLELLRCPRTGSALIRVGDKLVAQADGPKPPPDYPVIDGIPVLIDFANSVLTEEEVLARAGTSAIERPRYSGAAARVKRLVSPQKASTRRNVQQLVSHLARLGSSRVLVVGGGSVGQGMAPLYEHPSIKLFSFDIYRSELTHFIADAHQMPLASDSFDAVVVQAVLEHVLQPQQVVNEIWRVLKPSGLVYAETPFMQQVHEGAYDFTRFTESGHRYLFRDFELISSGASGGPGLQFMWSADYLARGVFRSAKAGKAAKLLLFWTQYLDRIIPAEFAVDGASGVYFLGAKSTSRLQPSEIIRHYKGAQ
ncbi:methyltransferase domain-containing protein [Rhodoligotrophos defluvii]|uniref:methyltransferase domain-containing protein n=1 Tax=Rhodoligotrophos defluvii TaxID=2561934 RepID=UPI0010C9CFBB|nr:methyltransferase domain-containing protein [Rhodoligotrophos defluvii]